MKHKEVRTKGLKNAILVACRKRYGQTSTVHKDRRLPRGGTKNKQREYLAELE
jgi:hypothetical protein